MGGIQKFLGLSSFKKKENVDALLYDEVINLDENENALTIYKDDNEEKSVMLSEIESDPREKNIPLCFMQTRYVQLSNKHFSCFNHNNGFFEFRDPCDFSFGGIPFETIKIEKTSEVKDFLFRVENNALHYFRFIRDQNTSNLLILFYSQDKFDKTKIVVPTVVQMNLVSFSIDYIKKGMGRMDEALYSVIRRMTSYDISVSLEEEIVILKELCLFLGFSMEYKI